MPERLPVQGEFYTDRKGNRYQFAGMARQWKTLEKQIMMRETTENEIYTVSVSDFTKEFQRAGEDGASGLLMDFLDARSSEEKLSILQKNRAELTEKFLEAAAQSLDFALSGDDPEKKFLDLEKYLRTKIKYERKRV